MISEERRQGSREERERGPPSLLIWIAFARKVHSAALEIDIPLGVIGNRTT